MSELQSQPQARPRQPKPMLSVGEALALMLGAVRPLAESELISTLAANGRILAKSQVSGMNVPGMPTTRRWMAMPCAPPTA
jgi:molybdopterin molybdotransferase